MTRTAVGAADPDPLKALLEISKERADLERRQEVAVRHARNRGYSWAAIAMFLGVSRQAAHKRYGRGT